MHQPEITVGKAPDQRHDDQRQQDVTGPFADILGQIDPRFGDARPARTIGPGNPARLGEILGQPFQHPVGKNQNAGADADVLVQSVEPVQPAETVFQPGRPGGEQHAGAHPPQRDNAGQQDQVATPEPGTVLFAGHEVRQDEGGPQADGDQCE